MSRNINKINIISLIFKHVYLIKYLYICIKIIIFVTCKMKIVTIQQK